MPSLVEFQPPPSPTRPTRREEESTPQPASALQLNLALVISLIVWHHHHRPSPYAYSDETGHPFRRKAATDSDANRPPIPIDAGHLTGRRDVGVHSYSFSDFSVNDSPF